MPQSSFFRAMASETRRLGRTYLNFKRRIVGDYTVRQLSAGAAYTIFCHAEIENFLEVWALDLTEYAERQLATGKITRPLAHLCTFSTGHNDLTNIPSRDIWNELFFTALRKHKGTITNNHGIKTANICRLFGPVGLDLRNIDAVLLADLDAFATIRGSYAHQSHKLQLRTMFDPFDRQSKANSLVSALSGLDNLLKTYRATF